MTIKSALSVVALAAGLAAFPVYAQGTTIAGTEIAAEDQAAVQAHCDELALEELNEGSLPEAEAEDNENEEANANYTATSIDLTTVSLIDCEEAGLVGAAAE